MKIVKISDDKAAETASDLFTGGKVTIQGLIDENDSEQLRALMVNFGIGAKNKLHTHSFEQILYVTKGRGIVATEKEQHVVTPGTIVFIPANEPHWHGATNDKSFSHISITRPGQTKINE